MDIVTTTKPHLDELKKIFKVDRNGVVRTLNESLNEYQTLQEKLLHNKDRKIATIKKDLGFRDKAFYALKATYNEDKITHNAVNTKFSLISNLLSAKQSDNQGLAKFKRIFSEDFIDFANKESSLAEEARMILDLQNIEHELDLIVNTEGIASKNIIAIGGGFSSGKSAFVSSFFKSNEIELPIGINPVTAIPSYITSGNKNLIKGLSNKGGSIDISTSLYKELSHDFVKSFDFNLKDIMPAMVIETEIEKYDQICFIDTPGYNPAATDGFTSEDKNTAQEFLEQANTLLWLIGLDSNGTIGQTDLDFLEALDLYDKELYIVANKADIRAESDLEDILDEIEESLEDCDILIAGISAYSGNMRKEYTHRKQKLFDFLDSQNKGMEASNNIKKRISYIIEAYRTSINSSKDYHKDISHSFKTIELDMVQYSYEGDIKEEADGLNEKIERLKNKLEKLNSSGQKNKYSSSLASSWLRVAGIQEEAHEDTKKSTKLKQKIKRLEENLEHLSDNLVDNLIQTTYLLKEKLSSTKKIKHLDAQLKTLDEIEVSFMESIDELFINIK